VGTEEVKDQTIGSNAKIALKLNTKRRKHHMEPEVQIQHFRDRTSSKGGAVTVASLSYTFRDEVRYGFAFCSPRDNFERKKGVELASHRLNTDPLVLHIKGSKAETTKFVLRLLAERNFSRLVKQGHTPKALLSTVPGWFQRWSKLMVNKGKLCLKAENPNP